MKKSNGIIAYTIIIAIVIALIFFFQRSLYTQTNVTYSQYRSFVEEEKIAQAQIEQNAKVPTGSVLFFVSGSSTEYRVFVSDVNAELDRLQDNGIKVTLTAVKENYFLNTLLPVLILVIGISFVFVAMTGRMAAEAVRAWQTSEEAELLWKQAAPRKFYLRMLPVFKRRRKNLRKWWIFLKIQICTQALAPESQRVSF